MTKVFLDTSYAIALSFPNDEFHPKAKQVAVWLDRNRIQIVTTRAILLEIGNSLSKEQYRRQAVDLLSTLESETLVEVLPLSDELYFKAFALFKSRMDKQWGLVDCVSYIAIEESGINQVLTADRHFQQMGFRALLRED